MKVTQTTLIAIGALILTGIPTSGWSKQVPPSSIAQSNLEELHRIWRFSDSLSKNSQLIQRTFKRFPLGPKTTVLSLQIPQGVFAAKELEQLIQEQ